MRARTTELLAAVMAVALLAACSPGRDTDVANASPTFRQVTDDALRYEQPISQVADLLPPTAEGEPWRVFGAILDPGSGRTQATVWSATQPPDWEVDQLDPLDSDTSEAMLAGGRHGEDLLAVGRVGDGAAADAALWRAEGESWRLVTPREMGGRHEQWAFDIAVGESGVLVAGGESVWGDVRPRMWFSPDGETWSSVDGGPGGPLDSTGEESVQAIAPFHGGFVAVGMSDVGGDQNGVVWFSPDGTTWEQVDAPATMTRAGRQNLLSVAVVNDTVVAGGYITNESGHGLPVVWRSADGRAWREASGTLPLHTERSAASDLAIRSLAVNGAQLIAAGGSEWQPHLWTSGDNGATWQSLPNPVGGGSVFKDGIDLVDAGAAPDGRVLGLGDAPTVLTLNGDRWLDATSDAFISGGNRPQATSVLADGDTILTAGFNFTAARGDQRERYTGRVWRREGRGVEVIEPSEEQPDLSAGKINDLARFAGGYVAVGFEDFSLAGERRVGEDLPDGLLWTSEDGLTWTRQAAGTPDPDANVLSVIEGDPTLVAGNAVAIAAGEVVSLEPAGGPWTRSLEAVAPLGDGFIAVGSVFGDNDANPDTPHDTDSLVVVSGDGTTIAGENGDLRGPGTQRFRDVCVSPEGIAIAVGIAGSDRDYDAIVRRRGTDGAWGRGATADGSFEGPGSQEAFGCATTNDGFLLVGTDDSRGNTDARVWESTDGLEWREVRSSALGGSGEQVATAVAAVPDGGWLVAGTDTGSGDSDVALWRVLDDGEIRRRDRGEPSLAQPGDQTVESVSVSGNRAIIVGQTPTGVGIWETGRLDR